MLGALQSLDHRSMRMNYGHLSPLRLRHLVAGVDDESLVFDRFGVAMVCKVAY